MATSNHTFSLLVPVDGATRFKPSYFVTLFNFSTNFATTTTPVDNSTFLLSETATTSAGPSVQTAVRLKKSFV